MLKKLFCSLFLFLNFVMPGHGAPLSLVTLEYPPYEYSEDRQVKGIAVDIVKEVFRRMEQPISITIYPWARALKMIELGQADAIFTAYKTPEREAFADYTNEVLIPQIVSLFVLKDSPIEFDGNINKLKEYRFGSVIKFSGGKQFDEARKKQIIPHVEETKSMEQNIKMLLKDRIDIWIVNKYSGLYKLKQVDALDKVKELSQKVAQVPSYLAFSKQKKLSHLRDKFDKTLAEMKKDGSYEQIVKSFLQQAH